MFSQLGGATQSSSPALNNPFATTAKTNGASSVINPFAINKSSETPAPTKPQQSGGFGGFGAPSNGFKATSFGGFGAASSNDAKPITASPFGKRDADTSDSERSNGQGKIEHKKRGINGDSGPDQPSTSNGPIPEASRPASTAKFGSGASAPFPPPAIPDSNDPHAQKVYTQLRKDGINPPKWPSNPGSPDSSNKMSKFRDEYEKYRDRVRKSLTKAGLIDDPEKRRALKDAIEFKGISEEMCPEFEKIRRITEFDVQKAETDPESSYAARARMVKKLARSAAGQEAPLPMDVRSIGALRRTMNYLVDDLLQHDENLPYLHGFLWDRTRAIRRDFTFFSTLAPDELLIQVSVLENIARFHVTSLHLLSKADVKPEDFSEHQENEQLGKTLLSLRDVYDDCNVQGIVCENETEFRGYYLIFHAMSPNIMETLQRTWKPELWRDSDEIRTAVSLVEALQSTSNFHGPLLDAPTMAISGGHHAYFSILEDPSISYTTACFAEIHFAQVRQSILRSISKSLARPQGETTDVSAATLNKFLRFDTIQEALDFAELHGLEIQPDPESPNDPSRQILKLQRNQQLYHPKLSHQYSRKVVEKKRGDRQLPEVIHQSVYPDPDAAEEAEEEPVQTTAVPFNDSLQKEAPKSNPFGQPAQLSQKPFAFPPQQPQAATSSTMPNGVPAPQAPRTNSPFGGFSSQAAPPSDNPFGPGFNPTNNNATSSTGSKTPSVFGSFGSETTGAQASSTEDTGDKAAPKVPQVPSSNPFGGNPTPKPSEEASKSAGTGSITTVHEISGNTTTPQSSPPEAAKKPMFQFPGTGSAPPLFPTTTTPGSSTPSVPSGSTADRPPQAPSSLLNSKPSADTSQNGQASSGQSLAPSPFAPNPAAIGSSLSSFGSKEQDNSASTLGSATAKDLFQPKAPLQPPAPPQDLMAGFTKWIVKGDGGLMADFEMHVLSLILEDTWSQFHIDEAEKRKLEEEEAIEREVETFRVKNIRIKTFYKWKRIARELRLGRVRRQGREDIRAWRIAEAEKKRKEAAKKATEERGKRKEAARAAEEDNRLSEFLQRKRVKRSRAEEDLIASGVLSGVANEHESARRIVHRTHLSADVQRPSTSDSKASSSASTTRKMGGKLQALRDRWSGEKKEGFRRSLPPGMSRSTASPEPKNRPSAASHRWKLKAMGLTEMPDGTALPESMADEVLYGNKRRPGLDSRPRSSSLTTTSHRQLSNGSTSNPFKSSHLSRSIDAHPPSPPNKRKRSTHEDTTPASSPPNKRVMSENEKLIQELRAMREDLEEGTQWFREHNEKFASSRGTTPWDESI